MSRLADTTRTVRLAGFSMIEMIVVTLIAGIALAGIWEYSVFQRRVGETMNQRIEYQGHAARVMDFLGNDIAKAGYGAAEIPGGARPSISEIRANDMALSTLDAGAHPSTRTWLDSMSMLAGVVPLPGSDELVLGSTLYSDHAVTQKMAVAVVASSTSEVDVYRMEGTDPFVAGEKFFVIDPSGVPVTRGTAADANLDRQIFTVVATGLPVGVGLNPTTASRFSFTNLAAMPLSFRAGSELYGMDPTLYTASINTQKFHKIQYALVDSGKSLSTGARLGTLKRYRFKGSGGTYNATNVESVEMAREVLDFQVQFLVWPCNSASTEPQWVDQPDLATAGFYDMSLYSPTVTTMTSPYVNRRMRVLGVRVLVFSAAETPLKGMGLRQIHLPGGATTFQVANHLVAGLDPKRHYTLHEEVYDPINYRIRDEGWLINDKERNLQRMKLGKCQLVR